MAWDDGLSTEQRNAAKHWGSSALVLAGPGTGKTRTLIQRVAYLIVEKKVPSGQIVVLTFTRAAANELKARLTQDLNVSEENLPLVCTLHAFSLRMLLQHHKESGIIQPLRVVDDYEEQHILFPEIGHLIKRSPRDVKDALRAFEATWNTLNSDHDEYARIEFQHDFELALEELKRFYGFTLRGELVYRFLQLLNGNPLLAEGMDVKHLLVDEYQDLNYCDQQVISRLEESGACLFVVGDDDQSIYEFRHAYPEGINSFIKSHSECEPYVLSICHRCPKGIITWASNLVSWNRDRIAKTIEPLDDSVEGEIYALQFKDQDDEASGIAAICKAYVEAGIVEPKNIAILLSRRKTSRGNCR